MVESTRTITKYRNAVVSKDENKIAKVNNDSRRRKQASTQTLFQNLSKNNIRG